jgi:antitoxin MazE
MLVSRWGNSLAVRLPKEIVDKLGLRAGDDLAVAESSDLSVTLRKNDDKQRRREEALKRLSEFRLPLPPGYTFDRDEIYDRPRGFSEAEREDFRRGVLAKDDE